MFAVVGNQKTVRVYDEETRTLAHTLSGGTLQHGVTPLDFLRHASGSAGGAKPKEASEPTATGHNSRVFSVAWHPHEGEGNILASGGWDNTVQIWDLRFVCVRITTTTTTTTTNNHRFTPTPLHHHNK